MKKEYIFKTLVFAIGYVILTRLSLLLAVDEGFATAVWVGSGLALSLLLIYGNNMWPAIAIGAFSINYIIGGSIIVASSIAIGNTLEALIAYHIIKNYSDISQLFTKLKGVITFIVASFVGSVTSALIGGFAVTLGRSNFTETMVTWCLGDVVSCLLIVPIIMLFKRSNLVLLQNSKIYLSFTLQIILSYFIFFRNYDLNFLPRALVYSLFILPLYASLSQNRLSSLLKVFVLSVFAVWGTILGKGPFIYPELNGSLIILQSFTCIITIVTLIVSVGIKEKELIEEKLSGLLKDKELLISEIHHRVKNNLAVVSGLLSLQNDTIDNVEIKAKLEQTQLRIKTIALVHDKLYTKTNISTVEFSDYIKVLSEMIQRLHEPTPVPVKIILDIEKTDIDIEKAVPIGLILNELLTNSFKHAFKDKESGEIEIKFHYKEKRYFLSVKDNGIGYENMNTNNSNSLGLILVNTLVQQINANFLFDLQKGAAYEFSFQ